MNEGDKNTKFFHRVTSPRKNSNYIKGLYAPNVEWTSDILMIKNILVNHFKKLYIRESGIGAPWNFTVSEILSTDQIHYLEKLIFLMKLIKPSKVLALGRLLVLMDSQ